MNEDKRRNHKQFFVDHLKYFSIMTVECLHICGSYIYIYNVTAVTVLKIAIHQKDRDKQNTLI